MSYSLFNMEEHDRNKNTELFFNFTGLFLQGKENKIRI